MEFTRKERVIGMTKKIEGVSCLNIWPNYLLLEHFPIYLT